MPIVKISVLLVDDHDLVRVGIRRLLHDEKEIKVIGEAKSGEEAIKLVKKLNPQVVLMDVEMPGIGGLEATKKLMQINPNIKVIILTVHNQEPFPSKLLQIGAQGYITKQEKPEEMVNAIKAVNKGCKYLSFEIAQKLALNKQDLPLSKLSKRELQILIMITSGYTVSYIATKLCLSMKTVNTYRYKLFEKLEVNNDVELTHLALRHSLIDNNKLLQDIN